MSCGIAWHSLGWAPPGIILCRVAVYVYLVVLEAAKCLLTISMIRVRHLRGPVLVSPDAVSAVNCDRKRGGTGRRGSIPS
ncbi:hypothetical protein HBI60_085560 [Parastagonospora nodorum]|nr:hypothetical protein HBI12_002670 [Parastagonospora nodorum]KAH6400133.1 hypothetical protein HBI60_085560 [Parastagonospora nodorum]